MKCSNLNCGHGIGLVSYQRGWFDKRRFCSKKCRDHFAAERPRPNQQERLVGSYFVAIATGLLLAVSGPSFAAKRTLQKSDTKSAVKLQSHSTKSRGSVTRPHSRDPYPYSQDPDPYAPGVNWPKGA